jgi:hypothetical protein
MLALGVYAAIGHAPEFVQANFLSIFMRNQPMASAVPRLVKELLLLAPFWLAIFYAMRRRQFSAVEFFLMLWGAAAVAGFVAFGTWLDHYTAPLLVPLAVLAAPALGWTPGRKVLTVLLGLVGVVGASANTIDQRLLFGNRSEVEATATVIRNNLAGGCFYMFEGDHIYLYAQVHTCTVTRFLFPQHLTSIAEAPALGVDQLAEVRAAFARHPSVIMTSVGCPGCKENPSVQAFAADTLQRDYAMVQTVVIGRRSYRIYQRKDVAARPGPQILAH